VNRDLAATIVEVAGALPADHLTAWCRVLREASRPGPSVETALIEARPGYALGGVVRKLTTAWQGSGLSGDAIALALETAGCCARKGTRTRGRSRSAAR
jgi:hypothetical protein